MGAYQQVSERLIERGFAAIPIMPGTKRPGFLCAGVWIGLSNWQKRYNNGPPPEHERSRWGVGDTGIGVIGGPASHGLIAIDIDSTDADIATAVLAALPSTDVRKIGMRGETLFYYGPGIEQSRSWYINGKCIVELIGPGRQTVLPPTLHPDGVPYRWSGSESLEDLEPHELPALPGDIADRITDALEWFGYCPEPEHRDPAGDDDDRPHRRLNDAALAELAAWIPDLGLYRCRATRNGGYEAVPVWRPSTTGRAPEQRHRNLKIVPEGIRDFGADQGYTPLDLVMAACGCDLDTAFRFLSERLGWVIDIDLPGLGKPPATPEQPEQPERPEQPAPPAVPAAPERPEQPEQSAEPVRPAAVELERFTIVPGAVGDIVDWIVATSRRPSRVVALGAAVTIVGTLIGRRVAGPTRSGTHLYVVGVAPTGYGKQRALDSVPDLLEAAGALDHFGSAKFFSLSAVLELMQEKPLVLCVQDEIGALLQSITSRKASNHEKAVSQILRTLWGCSFSRLPPARWATRKMRSLNCPALSIFGVSTTDEFHAALQGDQVANGFLNRFLVLASTLRSQEREPEADPREVPAGLAETLRGLYLWSGPISLVQIADPEAPYRPDVLPWASKQALNCYMEFVELIEQHSDLQPDSTAYLARCSETAIRLATIRAAGRWGHGATVDLSDMEWGAGLAWTATQAMTTTAQDFLPQNERGEITEKILGYVRRNRAVKPRDIQQFLSGRLRSQEIKDILKQLCEAGEIEWDAQGCYRPIEKRTQ
jgi:hypothetical protein